MSISVIENDVDDAESDTPPLRCQHDGCTNTMDKPARGRPPKYCPEHKATASKSPGSKGTRATAWANAAVVEAALTKYLAGIGLVVSFVNPLDGECIASGAEAVAHELVELGRADKNLRKRLEFIATPGKYGPLVMSLTPIVIPIMANHGLLPQFVIGNSDKGKGGN